MVAGSLALGVFSSAVSQTVPGFTVETFASVPEPVRLAFAPDGRLFVGRDPTPTGGGTPVHVHRVMPDGSVDPYGDDPTPDPDALVYDAAGVVSGVAGSVIVGGVVTVPTGRLSAIHPDGSVVPLFESTTFQNPADMAFDSAGRLLFGDVATRKVYVMTGGPPVPLFTISGSGAPGYLAIDSNDRIVTSSTDGRVRIHAHNGSVVDDDFASFNGHCALAFGPGGAFGTDLYVLEPPSGDLYRVDPSGSVALVGSGFAADAVRFNDIAFGPDLDLYMSLHQTNVVVRVSPGPLDVELPVRPPVVLQAFPNPFRSSVELELGDLAPAGLVIVDAAGRLVRRLGAAKPRGTARRLRWDGLDEEGRAVGPGVYLIRGAGKEAWGRVVLIR